MGNESAYDEFDAWLKRVNEKEAARHVYFGISWKDIFDDKDRLSDWLDFELDHIRKTLEQKYLQVVEKWLKENKEKILNLVNDEDWLEDNEQTDEEIHEKLYTDEEILEKIREDLISGLSEIIETTLQDSILANNYIEMSDDTLKEKFKTILKEETIENLVDSIVFDK